MTFEFKLSFELTLSEFCELCQKNGMSVSETKAAIISNMEEIVTRAKLISTQP